MNHLKKQSGQMVIEAILLITIFFSVVLIIASEFKEQEYFGQLIGGPWIRISGMIQNGVWSDPDSSMTIHPNSPLRHITLEGEDL